MKLARFLAKVRIRTKTAIPDDIDPIGIIMARVGLHPHTPESRALTKACLAVIEGEGDMAENDLLSLTTDALGLLDSFAIQRLAGRYSKEALATVGKRLRELVG